ncbi:phosphate ABC transporter substrate-binding/OmpA family protein [Marinobacterium jannaschii]|uniref:phosphate ABC transporter substrate-binding/OmpA family protein n=1 Tax=Marinobacterium jannaschii TaxID=64970 RepID=UPI000688A290|nr:phosphate ABC transporter substrate-binding/OmpA family protein [Marinobacterium jannaschii]
MKTTVFDLIWKLKRALEKDGHSSIELHRFTEDPAYRREIMLNVDISQFSADIQAIHQDLLSELPLDLKKEVILNSAARAPLSAQAPQEKAIAAPADKKGGWLYLGLAAGILLAAGGFMLYQKQLASDLSLPQLATQNNPGVTDKTPVQTEVPTAYVSAGALKEPASPQPAAIAEQKQAATEKTAVTAASVAPAVTVPRTADKPVFRLHGSNTIGEALAPELLKAFYTREGAIDLRIEKGKVSVEKDLTFKLPMESMRRRIEIQAHGSSTGFKDLDKNKTDLAMASRRIKNKERTLLEQRYGNLTSKGTEHIIGMDGLAIIVNPGNPLDHLSTAQLADLFSGKTENWSEIGGPDAPVRIYSRDKNSGTWDSFKSMVLKKHKAKLSPDAIRIESSVELSDSVSKELGAIGFIGLPYVLRSKALAVSDEQNAQPIYPTSFTISTEDYPLVRRLYIYEPATIETSSPAHQFIRFVMSEEGQNVVKKTGFISQNVYKTRPVLSGDMPLEYLNLVTNANRLSLNFRFNSSTFELDNKAQRDLDRVVKFFEDNPGQSAFLIGFSDSIGEAEANRKLSKQRAELVQQALFSRGINVEATYAMGESVPIASNTTRAGRQRNRRVEIWVRSPQGNLASN